MGGACKPDHSEELGVRAAGRDRLGGVKAPKTIDSVAAKIACLGGESSIATADLLDGPA